MKESPQGNYALWCRRLSFLAIVPFAGIVPAIIGLVLGAMAYWKNEWGKAALEGVLLSSASVIVNAVAIVLQSRLETGLGWSIVLWYAVRNAFFFVLGVLIFLFVLVVLIIEWWETRELRKSEKELLERYDELMKKARRRQ